MQLIGPQDLMPSQSVPPQRLRLSLLVCVLILSFTAIPSGLRSPNVERVFHPRFGVLDMVANTIGYIPLGFVLARRGFWRSVGLGAALSLFAETTQLFSIGRFPSLVDLTTNTLGAALGAGISRVWPVVDAAIDVTPRKATVAAGVAVIVGFATHVTTQDVEDALRVAASTPDVNTRGSSTPGRLEALWTFDRVHSDVALDESENGLRGRIVNQTSFAPGVNGAALSLNGVDQFLDVGEPVALRLTGSMTISAWINARKFAPRDAVIVSNRGRSGFQLDTTESFGPRTIGFRLANIAGQQMARYGKTTLMTNRWYHVAGVYDAELKKLDVYLDGRLDDGCLLGRVTSQQRVSRATTFIGRRSERTGFEFAGLVDNVRVFSRALSQSEIRQQFEADASASSTTIVSLDIGEEETHIERADVACVPGDPPDGRFSGMFVGLGMLIAVACVGTWPTAYRMPSVLLSFIAALLVVPSVAPLVPSVLKWFFPFLAAAGAVAVIVSVRSQRP